MNKKTFFSSGSILVFFLFFASLAAPIFNFKTASAASESYTFHFKKGKANDTKEALNAIQSSPVLQGTYVIVTGGVAGSKKVKLNYQTGGPTDTPDGSVISGSGHFFTSGGTYNCRGYTVNLAVQPAPPVNKVTNGMDFRVWVTSAKKGGEGVVATDVPNACRPNKAGMPNNGTPPVVNAKVTDDVSNGDPEAAGGGGEGQGTEEIECEASIFSISWIMCAAIEFGANFTNWFFNSFLRPLLEDVPVSLDPSEGSFQAWQGFRLLANIMLVASMLAIVYAQARGDQ